METLTIPKKLTRRGDLVVIPRKEYENLLRIQKQQKNTTRLESVLREKVGSVSDAEKKRHPEFYAQLDKDLAKAMAEYRAGKAFGPFTSADEMRKSLEK